MKEAFDQIMRPLTFLDWKKEKEELERMRRTVEEGRFFVGFLGQYSAGKSCLINHLLQRELLPHGVRETTALLTYIRYGEKEQAVLHYCDGREQMVSLEQVRELHQQNNQNLDNLEYIELFVSDDLLRGGMILMDTPGINTNIDRHEQLLKISLAQAAKVVYVMGGSPSQVDVKLVEGLVGRNISTVCVRTHFDLVNRVEEDPEQTKQIDREILSNCGVRAEECWFISNDPRSEYYQEIQPLQQMLSALGKNTRRELEQAAWARLNTLADRCIQELEDRRAVIEPLCRQDRAAAEQEGDKLEKQIQELKQSADKWKSELERKITEVRYKMGENGSVSRYLNENVEASAQRVQNSSVEKAEDMDALIRAEARKVIRQLEQKVETACGEFLDESSAEINQTLRELNIQQLPPCNLDDLQIEQDEEQEELEWQLRQLTEHKKQLEQQLQKIENSPEYDQLQEDLQRLEEEAVEAQQTYRNLPPYQAQMIQVANNKMQPSQIAEMIGSVADWALLLVPGTQVAAGLNTILKSSGALNKIAKAIGGFEKITNVIKKGDTIKDTVFTLSNLSKTYATAKRLQKAEKVVNVAVNSTTKALNAYQSIQMQPKDMETSGNLLDMLSISYWAKKAFKGLDRPPVMIEDQEWATQWKQEEQRVREEMLRRQREAFQKKLEARVYNSQAEELKAKKEADILEEKKIKKELEHRREKIRQQARKKELTSWRAECAQWYLENLRPQLQEALENWRETIPSRIGQYQRARLEAVQKRLKDKQISYQALLDAPQSENQRQLEQLDALLTGLRAVVSHD